MKRQGQFHNSGSADPYVAAQMQQHAQQMERGAGDYQGQLEAFTPERDDPFATSKEGQQQGWDRDGPAPSNPMASHLYYDGQGGDASRSFYQGMRAEQIRQTTSDDKRANRDTRSHSHDDKEINPVGYDKLPPSQSFEGMEQKFHDEIVKLTKELNDAEDAENARHREKLNSIDAQYQKQLEALRTRQASRRDDLLRRETGARQQQYQQAVLLDPYPTNRGMGPRDPQDYDNIAGPVPVGEGHHHHHRPYNPERFDSYGDRARFSGGDPRDRFEPRGPYQGGRSYDAGSRFY